MIEKTPCLHKYRKVWEVSDGKVIDERKLIYQEEAVELLDEIFD